MRHVSCWVTSIFDSTSEVMLSPFSGVDEVGVWMSIKLVDGGHSDWSSSWERGGSLREKIFRCRLKSDSDSTPSDKMFEEFDTHCGVAVSRRKVWGSNHRSCCYDQMSMSVSRLFVSSVCDASGLHLVSSTSNMVRLHRDRRLWCNSRLSYKRWVRADVVRFFCVRWRQRRSALVVSHGLFFFFKEMVSTSVAIVVASDFQPLIRRQDPSVDKTLFVWGAHGYVVDASLTDASHPWSSRYSKAVC